MLFAKEFGNFKAVGFYLLIDDKVQRDGRFKSRSAFLAASAEQLLKA